MLASLFQNISPIDQSIKASHILVILPKLEKFPKKSDITGEEPLKKLLLPPGSMAPPFQYVKTNRLENRWIKFIYMVIKMMETSPCNAHWLREIY